jgi:hypothetical protein
VPDQTPPVITDEAVEKAASAHTNHIPDPGIRDRWVNLTETGRRLRRRMMRAALEAALPHLAHQDTCTEPLPVNGDPENVQTCDHPAIRGTDRCPIHEPRHQQYLDGLHAEIRHLKRLHDERDAIERQRFPGRGIKTAEAEIRAASPRGDQG